MSSSSRACNIRTKGLFKKGNTLHRMFGPKVAVIVDVDNTLYSYVSHHDWIAIHQLLRSMGIRPENSHGPDQFDTVADRRGVQPPPFPNGIGSESQTSFSSMMTTPARQSVDIGRSDDHLIDELMSSLARNSPPSQLAIVKPALAEPTQNHKADLPDIREQGDRDRVLELKPQTSLERPGPVIKEEPDMKSRRFQHHSRGTEQGTKKRKRVHGGEDRRRNMITRSQDGGHHY